MKAIVYETGITGHVLHFTGLICESLSKVCDEVYLCLPRSAATSVEFETHIAPHLGQNLHLDDNLPDRLARNSTRVDCLLEKIRYHSPDYLYIPSGDGIVQYLALRRFQNSLPRSLPPIEALLLNGKVAYGTGGMLRRTLNKLSARLCLHAPIRRLFHLDPFAAASLNRLNLRDVEVMPEPVESHFVIPIHDARQKIGITTYRKIVGIAGTLNQRKGVDLFLNAARVLANDQRIGFLFAGTPDDFILNEIEKLRKTLKPDRLFLYNQYLTNEDLMHCICAMDLVATPHRDLERSSGIVTRAITAGVPVLGHDFNGWLASMVERYCIGSLCDTLNPQTFANAIAKSLFVEENPPREMRAHSIRKFHSVRNFQAHWTMGIRELLRLEQSSDLLQFSSI